MSLFVSFVCTQERTVEAHVGQPIPQPFKGECVDSLQADGDELELILATFTNIPVSSKRVQKWFGDHARFIFHNLKW